MGSHRSTFDRVYIDYARLFININFLVLINVFSKWSFVRIIKNITAKNKMNVRRFLGIWDAQNYSNG